MKLRYIGGEGLPGSGETFVFGRTVKVGEVCDLPPEFARKAKQNPAFEPVGGDKPSEQPAEHREPVESIDPPAAPKRGRPAKRA